MLPEMAIIKNGAELSWSAVDSAVAEVFWSVNFVSETIGWTNIICICGAQKMGNNDLGDPLTFPLVSP